MSRMIDHLQFIADLRNEIGATHLTERHNVQGHSRRGMRPSPRRTMFDWGEIGVPLQNMRPQIYFNRFSPRLHDAARQIRRSPARIVTRSSMDGSANDTCT